MTEERKTLQEIRQLPNGEKFKAVALITNITEKKDKNDKTYWFITLSDKSCSVDARAWNNCQWWDFRQNSKVPIQDPTQSTLIKDLKGQSIGINGQVGDYRGKIQFTLNQIFILDQEAEEYRPSNFTQASPMTLEALTTFFRQLIDKCEGECGDFLRSVYDEESDLWKKFQTLPAAVTHHHAYTHGLIEHTLNVASLAYNMALSYQNSPEPPDINFVIAGACLHDLGKLDTYLLSPAPSMTLDGTVIDHIARGYVKFCALAEKFNLSPATKTHLGHILLSHHGKREFGSPVLPATKEALIVAAADNLDFLLACYDNATCLLKGGLSPDESISDYDKSAERRFWKWQEKQPPTKEEEHELSV